MPDLRMPGLSRRTLVSLVAVMAGSVAMLVALLSGSSSPTSGSAASSKDKSIEPVAPLNPEDKGRDNDGDTTLPVDPFGGSFGASGRRKVTVSVSANGYAGFRVYYRDRKEPRSLVANPTFTETRTVDGRFPFAAVVMQVPGYYPGAASRVTCKIVIDGTEVSKESATKPWTVNTCLG